MAVESKSNRSCKHCLSNGRYIVEVTAVPVLDDVSASAGQLPTHLGRNIFTALCVSAVLALCLSVCLSVALVYCIEMDKDIVKLLSLPGSPSL